LKITSIKKELKEAVDAHMAGYDIGDVEQAIADVYDRGGVEQGLYAESYKASIAIKDYIKDLEVDLKASKTLEELDQKMEIARNGDPDQQGKGGSKDLTDHLSKMIEKYIGYGKSNKNIKAEMETLEGLATLTNESAEKAVKDALRRVDLARIGYESDIKL
jgi:hypothetical protein